MTRKLRVIQLINAISDGGAETLVKDYALHIDPNRFDVIILTEYPLSVKSANVRVLLEHGIKIMAPFGISKEKLIDKFFRKLRKLFIPMHWQNKYQEWYVKHQIVKYKPDVIHVHMKMLHYLPDLADKLKDTKLFYTCHSLPERYLNMGDCKNELVAAKFLIKNNNLCMIALHESMQKELDDLFHVHSTRTLYNCVDIANFRDVDISKSKIRETIGIPKNAFVIGHTGRFCQIKNQSFLVDIFYYIAQKKPDAFLLMIGGGDSNEIVAMIEKYGLSNRYKILSNRNDVNILLHAMDVFVFPSYYEGMPIALIEAQAAGLNCIASDSITSEAIVSNKAIQMDLNIGAKAWAEKIINDEFIGVQQSELMSFDVSNVMKEVEHLYSTNHV